MHPVRRNILVRWICYLLVILGMGGWIAMSGHVTPTFTSSVLKDLAPQQVNMPSEQVTEAIQSAIKVLRGQKAAFSAVTEVEPSLLRRDTAAGPGGAGPAVKISSLFMGPPDKFAVLNGVAYQEGGVMPDGRTVKAIERDAVVLALGEAEQRVPWIHPFRVELKKPTKEEEAKVFHPEETVAEKVPAEAEGATGEKVDIQNLPPDLTPDQALKILQKIGKK